MKYFIVESGSILPILSTILFVTVFSLVCIFLLTDKRKGHHERMASLSLDDNNEGDSNHG